MANSTLSIVSCSQSGNGGIGNFEFGATDAITTYYVKIWSTYSFKPTVTTKSLSFSLAYKSFGAAQTIGYRVDSSSTNSETFTNTGTFSMQAGADNGYKSHTATFTVTGTFNANTTYYLHLRCTTDNYGYGYLDSGTVTYSAATTTYTVSYNANGGTGAPSSQTKTHDVALTLSTTKPSKANTTAAGNKITFNANGGSTTKSSQTATNTTTYTFSKWNTKEDGSGTSYNSGGSYTANASATLYAQYTSSTTKGSVTLPTAAQCTRSGYALLGFATSSTATTAAYAPGASYTASSAATLYAVWGAEGLVYIDSGSGFEPHQVWIDNGSSWEQYAPFVDNGTSWEEMS